MSDLFIDPAPEPRDVAAEFLGQLFGGVEHGWINVFAFDRDTGEKCTEWAPVDQPGAAAELAMRHEETSCIYFGTATRRERLGGGQRGGAEHCLEIPALWLDIDIAGPGHKSGHRLPETVDEAIALLRDCPLPPTAVVHSGHGLQAFWLLEEPISADAAKPLLERWRHTWDSKAAARELHVDNVFEVARLMRLPGTTNRKVEGEHLPVEIVDVNWSRRYGTDDLDTWLEDPPPPVAPRAPSEPYTGSERPGDAFNATHSGADVLEMLGFHSPRQKSNGDVDFVRPGKTAREGTSATVYADGHVSVWSDTCLSAWPALKLRHGYDPLGLYVDAFHAGNFAAAAAALRAAGYGECTTPNTSWVPDGTVDAPAVAQDDDEAPQWPAGWTDAEVAQAFAAHIAGRYVWVRTWGWSVWDGTRWARDENESIHEECRQWVIGLGIAALQGDTSPETIKRITTYKSKARLDAVVTLARRQDGVAAVAGDFDAHPDLLNVGNGTVDLRTGRLMPHAPSLRLTKITGVDYHPDARHTDVDTVLEAMDDDARPWFQRLIGYAATGRTDEDIAPVLDGRGANGKTTIIEGIGAALGEYATTASTRLILATAHTEHATVEADLFGRRLVTVEETPEGGALRIERLKALTGGGRIKARFIGRDQFEFTPTHTLIIATNHRPKVNGNDEAIWRRLRLVPFPHTYRPVDSAGPGDRIIDRQLRHRLRTGRAQREAMLAWIVAGAVAWYRDGIGSCESVDEATDQWRRTEDAIAQFIDDRLVIDPDGRVSGQELFGAYQDWCGAEGRPAKSNKNFSIEFMDHPDVLAAGITKVRPRGSVAYRGVRRRDLLEVAA
jgi:putative DNA primase/helicase